MRAVDCSYCEADDEYIFRVLQRDKLPNLSPGQARVLYEEWREHYAGKCAQDRQDAISKIARFAEEQAKKNPPAAPFVCRCRATTTDPLDPAWAAEHMPHCSDDLAKIAKSKPAA